jgi:hypothetical protein
MRKTVSLYVILSAALVFVERWNQSISPLLFDEVVNGQFIYKFDQLKQSATLKKDSWSDTYWPRYQSRIERRWYTGKHSKFQLHALQASTTQELEHGRQKVSLLPRSLQLTL